MDFDQNRQRGRPFAFDPSGMQSPLPRSARPLNLGFSGSTAIQSNSSMTYAKPILMPTSIRPVGSDYSRQKQEQPQAQTQPQSTGIRPTPLNVAADRNKDSVPAPKAASASGNSTKGKRGLQNSTNNSAHVQLPVQKRTKAQHTRSLKRAVGSVLGAIEHSDMEASQVVIRDSSDDEFSGSIDFPDDILQMSPGGLGLSDALAKPTGIAEQGAAKTEEPEEPEFDPDLTPAAAIQHIKGKQHADVVIQPRN
ncbi:hypothetical protein DL89DRAFT_257999 [Linderina pennispora]|uniref:Uncharacterized protein n=1 Tax=Linderina pennispora TaxID=61395 RepID=A0A1Y1W9F3_9FUNG|nr:uncharacterized protein DL89DRAFT_257999 [Linderina pennispora]ORX69784.1 hypothetical protein DL89DRAFT_257999 [Linderina pennispora]